MPGDNLKALISDLHDSFGDDRTSPLQQQLMQQLHNYAHDIDQAEPVQPSLVESAEMLLVEMDEDYPHAAAIIRQLINTLGNNGI